MYKKMEGFAIVTGSSRGLGAGMAKQLAKEGYDVVINYVSEHSKEKAEAVAAECREKYGVGTVVFRGDVSDYAICKEMVEAGVKAFGDKIAVLVSNAGIQHLSRFEALAPEDYEYLIKVELLGSMHLSHIVLPYMQKEKNGCIIYISSVVGLQGLALEADYGAAKAGMHGFMRSLARENAADNIRINTIAPGLIYTDIFKGCDENVTKATLSTVPMGRFGEVEDIAECMSYIVNAKYLTGQIISPNGGMTMY